MATSALQAPANIMSADSTELPPVYAVTDHERVQQFLEMHPLAWSLLEEAPSRIAAIFGHNTPVRLEINFDPEHPQQRELWALIMADLQTPESVHKAEQDLRRLHEEWLIQLPRALSGSVHFDVEFA